MGQLKSGDGEKFLQEILTCESAASLEGKKAEAEFSSLLKFLVERCKQPGASKEPYDSTPYGFFQMLISQIRNRTTENMDTLK